MNRHNRIIAVASVLATLALAPPALAADYSLARGAVKFSAPDAWPMLMEKTEGDRQFVALQVKDPAVSDALARITVTVQQVDGLQGFQQFLDDGAARARKLPGYAPATNMGDPSSLRYTASENGHTNTYTEHYLFRSNLGIQVRCIRPAGAANGWDATFDAGCQSVVDAVKH